MVNVSDLTQFYYCPRKVYFLRTMSVPVHAKRKMEVGKEEHIKEMKRMLERKDVFGIPRDDVVEVFMKLFIEREDIGLQGLTDVILKLKSGDYIPVDIKYTDFVAAQRHWKKQLFAYAMLIDGRFQTKTERGVLYFPEQNRQLFVDISEEDKQFILVDIERIRELIASERIPCKVEETKCRYCEVARFCV